MTFIHLLLHLNRKATQAKTFKRKPKLICHIRIIMKIKNEIKGEKYLFHFFKHKSD